LISGSLGSAVVQNEAAARKSYEEFLNLWKDADPDPDPDVPNYRQTKAEYAKLAKS
jgi:hypothetical protein